MTSLPRTQRNSVPSGFLGVVTSTAITAMFRLVYWVFYLINTAGTNILSNKDPQNSSRVQLGRILWKRKFHPFEYASARDFLCIFSSKVAPEYVLKHNVSLYAVTTNEAIFVETKNDINIYSSDEHPFFHMAQFNRSENVIKMSIETFHALAKKIRDPSVPVICISHIRRCGSTLLLQVFEKIPGTLVIAEPDALTNIEFMLKRNQISEYDRENLVRSVIRVLCKPRPGTERICIKPRGICCSFMMKDISKCFPKINQVFMYRNCIETTYSYLSLLGAVPYTELARICFDSKWFIFAKPVIKSQFGLYFICKSKESTPLYHTLWSSRTVCMLVYMWIKYILIGRDALSRDQNILAVKYEDLVSNKFETCRMLFEKFGIDVKHLNVALSAFSKDSQRGTVVSRDRMGPRTQVSEFDKIKCDAILSSFNLPQLGDDFRM